MARIRNIKPSFYLNDEIAALPAMTRLAFPGLWCLADREGRLEDRPARIKAQVFPYDEIDMEAVLAQLAAAGFIVRYETGGNRYIQVVNFTKHQSPHVKEAASTIPAPGSHESSPPDPDPGSREGSGGGIAPARMTPTPQDAPSGERPEGDVASSENTGLDGSAGQANDRERAAAALGSAAARHQRQLSAHKRAAGWSFTEADRALLIDAGEALGIEAAQLPGEVGHRLARGDGPAYERWYELSASEVAAWCAKAVTAAARAGKLEASYVAGIIRQRLEANRPAPGDQPAGNVVAFPAAAPPPPAPEPYRDRPWGSFFYAVKGIPERDRLRDVARNLEENYRWPVDEAIALAKFDADGLVAGMDYLWSCRPAEGAAS